MADCSSLDPFVTPYVDGELNPADRQAVSDHIRVCVPCRSRVTAEQAAREFLRARKAAWLHERAPEALRARCAALADGSANLRVSSPASTDRARRPESMGLGQRIAGAVADLPHLRRFAASGWRTTGASLALAATLVLTVSGAFVYRLTQTSARVMAAELTADHVKCFALNSILGTHQSAAAVESYMASSFDWPVRLPDGERAGLELVGSRPCLYGDGRVAHIMFKHNGRPVSLFMLPGTTRSEELVDVLGHQAAIWCVANRTFVLIANDSRPEVERIASIVHASLR